MNMNAENEMKLIEENSFFSMALTKSINIVLEEKIKEKEKGAHPSNMNPNKFRNY